MIADRSIEGMRKLYRSYEDCTVGVRRLGAASKDNQHLCTQPFRPALQAGETARGQGNTRVPRLYRAVSPLPVDVESGETARGQGNTRVPRPYRAVSPLPPIGVSQQPWKRPNRFSTAFDDAVMERPPRPVQRSSWGMLLPTSNMVSTTSSKVTTGS